MILKQSTRLLYLVLLGVLGSQVGCDSVHEERLVTADELVAEIDRLSGAVHAMPPGAVDAVLRALNSVDPTMRAEAAMSLGKSNRLTQPISRQLEILAINDTNPIVRAAALSALFEHGTPSREMIELAEHLCSDPQLSSLATRLSTEKKQRR
ncbi:HEAT repeat domain-containing protein [Stieleria sp. ICT_E10.1]|uniref:HEAT repeat domain-containing protein n=1 Tax=Stieleria sedimenti TaxID=2976331 RepID=UPI00217F269C|nr:HEAT repeat domain-containing protein [Stieleria sedimenti]MCS7466323.1 HEAT repeat domain-containing protein [Stieleria sedimenti]